MSSKISSDKLEQLLQMYNSYMWDIVRAYIDSKWNVDDLVRYLVENKINLTSKTIIVYTSLYKRLKKEYTDNAIDKRTPRQWMDYIKKRDEKHD